MKWINSIRSVTTFLLVATACTGFIIGRISGEQFIGMVMMVLTFYFGMKDRSAQKSEEKPKAIKVQHMDL